MATGTQTPQPTETRSEQVNIALTPAEKADVIRRAGEVQSGTGEVVTAAEYIRSQLWPNGLGAIA